jgi:hypothetical protein
MQDESDDERGGQENVLVNGAVTTLDIEIDDCIE